MTRAPVSRGRSVANSATNASTAAKPFSVCQISGAGTRPAAACTGIRSCARHCQRTTP